MLVEQVGLGERIFVVSVQATQWWLRVDRSPIEPDDEGFEVLELILYSLASMSRFLFECCLEAWLS